MFLRKKPALILFGGLLIAGPVRTQEPLSYDVRAGDQVAIEFYTAAGTRLAEVSGERTVDRNGRIYLPYVGTVELTGLDAPGIREVLTQRFSEFYDSPVVDVTVLLRVNVTGAVRLPGSYFLDPASTIVDALSRGGGTGTEVDIGMVGGAADPSQVRLVRGGTTETLNLRPDEATPEVLTRRIQSGDWLYVPPRPRSRWRDNIQFISTIVGLVAGVATVVIVTTR